MTTYLDNLIDSKLQINEAIDFFDNSWIEVPILLIENGRDKESFTKEWKKMNTNRFKRDDFHSYWLNNDIENFAKEIFKKFDMNYKKAHDWLTKAAKHSRMLWNNALEFGQWEFVPFPENLIDTLEKTLKKFSSIYNDLQN